MKMIAMLIVNLFVVQVNATGVQIIYPIAAEASVKDNSLLFGAAESAPMLLVNTRDGSAQLMLICRGTNNAPDISLRELKDGVRNDWNSFLNIDIYHPTDTSCLDQINSLAMQINNATNPTLVYDLDSGTFAIK